MTVTGMLDAFSSSDPLPAGAAAAALTGALGVSLLVKMARIGRLRDEAISDLVAVRPRLLELADADSRAYAQVLVALRLPKTTAAEAEERRARLGPAMRTATEVPLEMLRACRDAARRAPEVAEVAPAATAADVSVALALLRAAVQGTCGSVDANLGALRDRAFADQVRKERLALEQECRGALERAGHRAQLDQS
jgi:formiminotetrahydrofolate cyclodeaminase